eukprot:5893065-Pyramimonas_sp.AAC.2
MLKILGGVCKTALGGRSWNGNSGPCYRTIISHGGDGYHDCCMLRVETSRMRFSIEMLLPWLAPCFWESDVSPDCVVGTQFTTTTAPA